MPRIRNVNGPFKVINGVNCFQGEWLTVDVPTAILAAQTGDFEVFVQAEDMAPEDHISFMGSLDSRTGYGGGGIDIVNSLQKDFTVHIDPLLKMELKLGYTADPAFCRVQIMHSIPDHFRHMYGANRVGWTMTEQTALPKKTGKFCDWAEACNAVDHLVFPTKFSQEVFEDCGVKTPSTIIPYGIDGNEWPFQYRPDDGIFTVVLWGDLQTRKSPMEAYVAFQRAFPNETDVRLIFKTHNSAMGQGVLGIPAFSDKRVKVINELWDRDQLRYFLSKADCLLWLSKGEGFGLPPLQAALSGVPVILGDHSGMREYFREEFLYGIEYTEVDSPLEGGKWFSPNLDSAVDQLRRVYETHQTKGQTTRLERAADYYRREFSLGRFREKISSLVRSF